MHYYVHIPFCKSRCAYCDFFSTTQSARREAYVDALLCEIALRRNGTASTIYLGGGTPSVLPPDAIRRIIQAIDSSPSPSVEITMEANPGDLTIDTLNALRAVGINRLSIGIQSFQNDLLRLIGRRHNAQQAQQAVRDAQQAGFRNISIDLMYGLPGQSFEQWKTDIEIALCLNVQHISCYCLSYETGTRLTRLLQRGEIKEQDDDTLNTMYDYLCEQLALHGYEHYEVSNFALPHYRSQHNSCYWADKSYIGFGAGAHSYDAERRIRSWNVSDLEQYIAAMNDTNHRFAAEQVLEQEQITDDQHRMEQIMLGLRTSSGVPQTLITDSPALHRYLEEDMIRIANRHYIATQKGIHLLNRIIEDLV